MTTEQMIAVVDSYVLTRAEGNEKLLKYSLIAAYAVELGYQASGCDFARNREVVEHIEWAKCFAEVEAEEQTGRTIVPAHKNLDIAGFMRTNGDDTKLAQALAELDAYWKRIYQYAEKTAQQNRALMKEKSGYESALKKAVATGEDLKAENAGLLGKINKLTAENRYLRKMLRTYLYPAVADKILVREGALKKISTQASEAAVRDMTEPGAPQSIRESVAADVDLQSDEERLLAKMWGMCDE